MDFYLAAITQGLGYASLGLGIYISLKIFNIPDITTDGSYTLGGAVTAVLLSSNHNPFFVACAAMLAGACAGIATGIIHTRLKVHALLAGILVMTALYSINLLIMDRPNIPLIGIRTIFSSLNFVADAQTNQLIVFILFVALLSALIIWLLKTDFGIAMRATGNSETMVRAMGVNTNAMKIIGLALANALTAFSGFLITQYQGFADVNMGIGIVISGLGAVIIGESVIKIFKSNSILLNIVGVIAGTILFRLLLAFALSLGMQPTLLKLVTAVIVLLVIVILKASPLTPLQRERGSAP